MVLDQVELVKTATGNMGVIWDALIKMDDGNILRADALRKDGPFRPELNNSTAKPSTRKKSSRVEHRSFFSVIPPSEQRGPSMSSPCKC